MIDKSESSVFFNHWGRPHRLATRGAGVHVYDDTGKAYLDAIGGMYVNAIGYGVPEIAAAMAEQARTLSFAHRLRFSHDPQERLADRVVALAPPGLTRVFFTTGGSTANEMALRIVRHYHLERGRPDKHKVVGRRHSYHGSTVGAMSMSADPLGQEGMAPYELHFPRIDPPYCYRCPLQQTYPGCELACASALAHTLEHEGPETVAAFIAEPLVSGVGSAIRPPPGYYEKIREICDRYDVLFVADEVVTGFGRTGKAFGIDHWRTIPDIITAAKALSSGYAPLGAVILHRRVWETLYAGKRPGIPLQLTYAGHPVACAAALAVQEYVARHDLVARCAAAGASLGARLERLAAGEPWIGEVRGEGLLRGVEFVQDRVSRRPFPRSAGLQEKVVEAAFEEGLLLIGRSGTGATAEGDHISMAPPFVITEAQCDELVAMLARSIEKARARL